MNEKGFKILIQFEEFLTSMYLNRVAFDLYCKLNDSNFTDEYNLKSQEFKCYNKLSYYFVEYEEAFGSIRL